MRNRAHFVCKRLEIKKGGLKVKLTVKRRQGRTSFRLQIWLLALTLEFPSSWP